MKPINKTMAMHLDLETLSPPQAQPAKTIRNHILIIGRESGPARRIRNAAFFTRWIETTDSGSPTARPNQT